MGLHVYTYWIFFIPLLNPSTSLESFILLYFHCLEVSSFALFLLRQYLLLYICICVVLKNSSEVVILAFTGFCRPARLTYFHWLSGCYSALHCPCPLKNFLWDLTLFFSVGSYLILFCYLVSLNLVWNFRRKYDSV